GSAEELTRVESALALIRQHSPLDYARIMRELERIWVHLALYGVGEYRHSLKACVLDERFVADRATTREQIASTIVHEATHARLERYGITYKEELRTRIEAICFRRELAFAVRLPDSAGLRQELAQRLEWYQANPDQFSDAQFRAHRQAGEIEVLRYLGTPDWLITAMRTLTPTIRRARRWSPVLACALLAPAVVVFGLTFALVALFPKALPKRQPP